MFNFSPSFDIGRAYQGGYGDFTGKLNSGSSGGTKAFGMDPLSLGLGLGSSLIGGLFGSGQAATSASIAQAQLAAQNQAILEGREQNKLAFAQSMFGPVFQAGTGGDASWLREKTAKDWLAGAYADRQIGIQSEASKRERLARISPESKEAARFENRLAIDRALAERRAVMEGMFGPISSSRSFA